MRGSAATTAISAIDMSAGTSVSHSDRSGPTSPVARIRPNAATAKKLTELLMRKKATERRAMRSASIPRRCRIHAPRARPPIPLAGTIDPIPSSTPPISALVRHDIERQKIGRNMRT